MSGGQQQRVAIARALVKYPRLILADEPTGALDEGTQNEVLAILKKLHKQGKTIIIRTHDPNVASSCQEIIYLKDGKSIGTIVLHKNHLPNKKPIGISYQEDGLFFIYKLPYNSSIPIASNISAQAEI